MLTFAEYYGMLVEAKQPSFRKYVTDIYNDLKLLKDYKDANYKDKPRITNVMEERAVFAFNKTINIEKTNDTIKNIFEKWHKGIATLLGIKSKPKIRYHNSNTIYEYKDVKLPNGITVTYTSELDENFSKYQTIRDVFEFVGKKTEAGEQEFDTYPEYKPGAILYTSYGYNATHVNFYQIVKRSGNMIYCRKLKNNYLTGGGYNGKVVADKDDFDTTDKEIYSGRLPNPKLDTQSAALWDGKPKYYNTLD